MPVSVAAAWTAVPSQSVCGTGGPDSDSDHLTDTCEQSLLQRFAPVFVASPSACNWDTEAARLEGGYLVGAEPIPGGVRLAYLPAYFEDCGWSGPKCLLRLRGGCSPRMRCQSPAEADAAWTFTRTSSGPGLGVLEGEHVGGAVAALHDRLQDGTSASGRPARGTSTPFTTSQRLNDSSPTNAGRRTTRPRSASY